MKDVMGMFEFVKNFLWGTFNYRNKGIPIMRWHRVGYFYAIECAKLERM